MDQFSAKELAHEVIFRTVRRAQGLVAAIGPAIATGIIAWASARWDSRWPWVPVSISLLILSALFLKNQQEDFRSLSSQLGVAQAESESANARVARLEGEIRDAERALQLVLNCLVRELAITLRFRTPRDRVSVYFHSGSEFVMAARYSADPLYHAPGRGRYPDSTGLISRAWRNQVATFRYRSEPEWRSAQLEDFGFTEAEVGAFVMRPLSMAGVRLECNKQSVGVLVIESTHSEGATPRVATQMRRNAAGVSIAELLQNHSERVPGLRV